jgi:NitT/TauT family transport system ATP-binding protein
VRIECQHLTKLFWTGDRNIPALEDLTFRVEEREFVCIVGPSGCGKTTLLKIVAGLLEPSSGRILFSGNSNDGQPRSALVFQEHGLFPWMNVMDNVAFGLEMRGMPAKERRDQAMVFIEKIGLASFSKNYPHELSVGMRQRVGIARAFIINPQILLMDEPFGALDAQTKRVLRQELLRIWEEHQKLVLFVTHDIEEAVLLGDRVLVMSGHPGRIREEIAIPKGPLRDLPIEDQPECMEIKWHIWKILEEEVRKTLGIPS